MNMLQKKIFRKSIELQRAYIEGNFLDFLLYKTGIKG